MHAGQIPFLIYEQLLKAQTWMRLGTSFRRPPALEDGRGTLLPQISFPNLTASLEPGRKRSPLTTRINDPGVHASPYGAIPPGRFSVCIAREVRFLVGQSGRRDAFLCGSQAG